MHALSWAVIKRNIFYSSILIDSQLNTHAMAMSHPYILKAGDRGDWSPPIFFIFRQSLGWERENH